MKRTSHFSRVYLQKLFLCMQVLKTDIIKSTVFHFLLLASFEAKLLLFNGIPSVLQRDASWLRLPRVALGLWDLHVTVLSGLLRELCYFPRAFSSPPALPKKCILPSLIHAEDRKQRKTFIHQRDYKDTIFWQRTRAMHRHEEDSKKTSI